MATRAARRERAVGPREAGPWVGKIAVWIRRPLSPADLLCQNGTRRPRSPGAGRRVALLTRRLPARDLNSSPAPSWFGTFQSRRQEGAGYSERLIGDSR